MLQWEWVFQACFVYVVEVNTNAPFSIFLIYYHHIGKPLRISNFSYGPYVYESLDFFIDDSVLFGGEFSFLFLTGGWSGSTCRRCTTISRSIMSCLRVTGQTNHGVYSKRILFSLLMCCWVEHQLGIFVLGNLDRWKLCHPPPFLVPLLSMFLGNLPIIAITLERRFFAWG